MIVLWGDFVRESWGFCLVCLSVCLNVSLMALNDCFKMLYAYIISGQVDY